jgi:pyruvate dehydrogenase E2 component (dihydrolipoamide acetyltransferase)
VAKEQVVVPDIGGAEGAEVIELLVAVGDTVEVEQSLIVLESDKASMEIPSNLAGIVVEVLAEVGKELAEGDPIVLLEVAGSASATAVEEPVPAAEIEKQAVAPEVSEPAPSSEPVSSEQIATVPDIGTDESVDVIEVSVALGDTVAKGDSLVVLESDKASMEVPAPFAGQILKILVKENDSVKFGHELMVIKTESSAAASAEVIAEPEVAAQSAAPAPVEAAQAKLERRTPPRVGAITQSDTNGERSVYAGPAVRKLAREFGLNLANISGTGPRDRLLKEDVQNHVKDSMSGAGQAVSGGAGIPAIPVVDFASFGPIEEEPLSKMAKLTAANMQRSWLNVPHVTQFDNADVTDLEAFRAGMKTEGEKRGVKLTPLPFILKACAVALRDHPKFRSSLSPDSQSLVYKHYIHIGMAVDTPAGLLVPVIRDVDKKTIWELAEEVVEVAGKARDRKLKPTEMQGGCFTISSLGNIGGTGFTPIVNAPEVGILGVSKAAIQPVWDGEEFQPRKLLPLGLSYDHRVINGADAGLFFTQLVALLGDIRRLSL